MRAEDHPWLDGRFPLVQSLSAPHRIWTFLAGHTATGDLEGVKNDWQYLAVADQAGGLEIILQTLLFAGFPRTINALAAVREVGIDPEALTATAEDLPHAVWMQKGRALCQSIYAAAYPPLRDRMSHLHPMLDRWMIEAGYGRVLSRPHARARERELCVIAVLAGQNVRQQLRSHLHGALNVGATREECRAVLDQTAALFGAEAQKQVDVVWERLEDLI